MLHRKVTRVGQAQKMSENGGARNQKKREPAQGEGGLCERSSGHLRNAQHILRGERGDDRGGVNVEDEGIVGEAKEMYTFIY